MCGNYLVEWTAGDVLHDDKVHAGSGTDIVNRDDVGMIQRGCSPRLLNESPFAFRIGGLFGRQNLDGDSSPKTQIASFVYGAHAALTDLREDFVVSEGSADHRLINPQGLMPAGLYAA
jgi:hypothetical protein